MVKIFFKLLLLFISVNVTISVYGQNDKIIQFDKGINYFYGANDVKQDYDQAYKCFKYSAELGMAEAQFMLSFCYLNGLGVDEDEDEAFEWMLKSSEQGLPNALFWIGRYYIYGLGCLVDKKKGFDNVLQAANAGLVEAEYFLGSCYMEAIGTVKNEKKGFDWTLKAAEKGLAEAQNSVGWYYATGQGVPINYKEAIKWYEKAMSQNNAWAYNNMGYMYFEGNGIEKDINKAFEFVDKAIKIDPDNLSFYDSKGEFYSRMGDEKQALEIWNKIISLNPKFVENDTRFVQYIKKLSERKVQKGEGKLIDEWVIYPQYDYASSFVDGLSLVKVGDKYGYINKKGEYVISPKYIAARDFKEGMAIIGMKIGNKLVWGIIDVNGKSICSPIYSEIKDYSEGYAAFYSSAYEKWGFMDKRGKMIIPTEYDDVISSFQEGFAHVIKNGVKGFINKNGEWVCSEQYNKIVYKELKQRVYKNQSVLCELYPKVSNGKWGYQKATLDAYINTNIQSWDVYLSVNLPPLVSYENYLKYRIEPSINQWQQKGEFEPTTKWKERVNETTRKQKIDELTIEYKKEYEEKLASYKKRYTELVEEYKEKYNRCRDEFYTLIIQSKQNEFKMSSFDLLVYDADNQSFMIKSNMQGDILMSVPLEEAPSFKQNWNTIKNTITPTFVPSGNDVVLTSVTVTNGNKKYVYDSHTQAKYAITDINYNFDPVEISIPEVADVNYTFDPVEVIQSTVVQTLPNVKGLEANNANIERNIINATKQSDVDMNIPQNTMQKNSNTFAVIIANEDYQRVSDVMYAANDGKLFAEYCQKTLGLPQNHVMVYNDATLGNMLGAVSRIKEIGEAYNGKVNVVFYYAGHGIPDETSKDAYLLPIDGDGSSVRTCYKQSELYTELASINAESIVVFMDACFSGSLRGNGMLASARGVAIKVKKRNPIGNMVVFSAAQGDETAYPYNEQRHGMFTYYLLKKLQETKGEATLGEISDYVTSEVRKQSIVINGKMQTPTLTSSSAIGDAWRNWKLK